MEHDIICGSCAASSTKDISSVVRKTMVVPAILSPQIWGPPYVLYLYIAVGMSTDLQNCFGSILADGCSETSYPVVCLLRACIARHTLSKPRRARLSCSLYVTAVLKTTIFRRFRAPTNHSQRSENSTTSCPIRFPPPKII